MKHTLKEHTMTMSLQSHIITNNPRTHTYTKIRPKSYDEIPEENHTFIIM